MASNLAVAMVLYFARTFQVEDIASGSSHPVFFSRLTKSNDVPYLISPQCLTAFRIGLTLFSKITIKMNKRHLPVITQFFLED